MIDVDTTKKNIGKEVYKTWDYIGTGETLIESRKVYIICDFKNKNYKWEPTWLMDDSDRQFFKRLIFV